jgi:hypothetical protein
MGGIDDNATGVSSALIQSGVYLENGETFQCFIEVAPASAFVFPVAEYNAGDTLETWGATSTNEYCDDWGGSLPAAYGCFWFYDDNNGIYVIAEDGYPVPQPVPSGTSYYGYTFESIVERNFLSAHKMIDFDYTTFSDAATDYYGYYHDVTTDPWILLTAYYDANEVANIFDPSAVVSGNTMPYEVDFYATY